MFGRGEGRGERGEARQLLVLMQSHPAEQYQTLTVLAQLLSVRQGSFRP